jgi:protein phosphatase
MKNEASPELPRHTTPILTAMKSAIPPSPTRDGSAGLSRYRLEACAERRGELEWFDGICIDDNGELPVRIAREPRQELPIDDARTTWPNVAWEAEIRARTAHLGMPRVLDRIDEADFSQLVIEKPIGIPLWDAWDRAAANADRFQWLIQLADVLHALHRAGGIVESLRPDQIWVTALGQVVLGADVVLLPLPLPPNFPLRLTTVSAPELLHGGPVDARSDLYHFGSVLYSLELGRELTPLDFEFSGVPRPVLERHPEINPCLGRMIARTFTVDRAARFPSEDPGSDLTGFEELLRTLERARGWVGRARLDIAAWTSTGMVRRNNEDAALVVHASELREAAADDWAVIGLADGMGGTAAGEVAAAITIQTLRRSVLRLSPLSRSHDELDPRASIDNSKAIADCLGQVLREANEAVYLAGRDEDRRGMGCTAEVVIINGQRLVVGHVGDSRTYHFTRGEMRQLTRDHTYVATLVEQGILGADEAQMHPRRGELMQAIGGRADVTPEMIHATFSPDDWLIVCSDGLTARLTPETMVSVLEQSHSADAAARRLVNRANLEGAADNVTVVVVRGC